MLALVLCAPTLHAQRPARQSAWASETPSSAAAVEATVKEVAPPTEVDASGRSRLVPRFRYLSRFAGRDESPARSAAYENSSSARALLVPVLGVRPEDLMDSFTAPRSGGRVHRAIDIFAPRGTPVLAASDGTILKMDENRLGGLTIYHLADDGRTRYYYAHLDGYARGLREGERVRKGQTIGYVGNTGNAKNTPAHLHFSIALLEDTRRWWEGRNVNPYDLLTQSSSALLGRPVGSPAHELLGEPVEDRP